jgi:anti-sigma B factor antagonist
MEIISKDLDHARLIAVTGRVDSVEASRLVQALKDASDQGQYRIIVDMSQLEYMSSAGFRALGDAQRSSQRAQRGEVILAQVPALIHEALELVGFVDYFKVFEDVMSAVQYAENLAANVSAANPPSPAPET